MWTIPYSLAVATATVLVDTTFAFRPGFSLGSPGAMATASANRQCSHTSACLNLLAESKRAVAASTATGTTTFQAAIETRSSPQTENQYVYNNRRPRSRNQAKRRNVLLPELFDLFATSSAPDPSLQKKREDMLREEVYNPRFGTALLESWARSRREDAAERCMLLLTTFKKLASSSEEEETIFRTNGNMYRQILETFAIQGRGQEAEWTLKNFMLNDTEAVLEDPQSVKEGFKAVLKAWARSTGGNNPVSPEESMKHCLRVLEEMKHMASNGFQQVKPDQACYGAAIKAYCQRGLAEEAEEMLMEQIRDPTVRASAISFSPVMSAWAKIPGALGLARCLRIFNVMKTMALEHGLMEVDPNMYHYNIVLDAFARRGMAEEAQKVLDYVLGQPPLWQQQQRYRQDPQHTTILRPDMYSFASVARAWVDSGSPEAPDRCRDLLQQIRTYAKAHDYHRLKPDTVLCNTILSAFASHDQPEEAERLLNHMLENTSFLPYPDIISFNFCLKAWADASVDKYPQALSSCTDLMKRLQHLKTFRRQRRFTPNNNTYFYLIFAHIRRGKLPKASSLYLEMLEAEKTEVHYVLMNQLFHGWAKSDPQQYPNAPENMMRLMQDIQTTAQKNGKGAVRLDVQAYTALINAYGDRGRPQEAEAVLAELWEKHPEGPDLFSFNGVVKAWSNVRVAQDDDGNEGDDEDDDIALTRCEQLVNKMNDLADQEGREDLRPDLYTYTSLFEAYAGRGMGKEAQDLLESNKVQDAIAKCPNVQRQSRVYFLTMKAWVASHVESGPERCFELLDAMVEQQKIVPAPRTYNVVLMALVSHGRVKEAEEFLLTSKRQWCPDFYSYNIVLNGWARHPNATMECQRFFNKVTEAWTEQKDSWQLYPNAVSVEGDEFVFDRSHPKIWRRKGDIWQQQKDDEAVSSESLQVLLDKTLETLEGPYGTISPTGWRELCR